MLEKREWSRNRKSSSIKNRNRSPSIQRGQQRLKNLDSERTSLNVFVADLGSFVIFPNYILIHISDVSNLVLDQQQSGNFNRKLASEKASCSRFHPQRHNFKKAFRNPPTDGTTHRETSLSGSRMYHRAL